LLAVGAANSAHAATLLWETTFPDSTCPTWNQSMGYGDAQVCATGDGISGFGGWTTALGSEDEIIAAANHPNGAGGKGFRHWRGDGWNVNGGGIAVNLPSPQTEFWMRFYARWEQGFYWASFVDHPHYTKDIYFFNPVKGSAVLGFDRGWGAAGTSPGGDYRGVPGWKEVMGGIYGDGLWHCYEAHFKVDTNGSNGIAESWVDGVQNAGQTTNVDWGGTQGN